MNKLKTVLLILFAVIIILLVFFMFKNLHASNNDTDNSKLISEIKYMDNKLSTLLNAMNNINLDNYKMTVTKTSTGSNSQEQNSGSSGGETSKENKSQDSKSNGDSEDSQGSNNSNNSSTETEKYAMQQNGILSNDFNTDWDSIKNEVEIFYTILPTITLDLYSMNVTQNEILNFNKEVDDLTVLVKEENKEETLKKLASLYSYLPKYAKNISDNPAYAEMLEIKSNVFNAYALLDTDDWNGIINYMKKAEESCVSVLNSIENMDKKSEINKIYIILNELENAANLKDRDVFLIKYKMFLEVMLQFSKS